MSCHSAGLRIAGSGALNRDCEVSSILPPRLLFWKQRTAPGSVFLDQVLLLGFVCGKRCVFNGSMGIYDMNNGECGGGKKQMEVKL